MHWVTMCEVCYCQVLLWETDDLWQQITEAWAEFQGNSLDVCQWWIEKTGSVGLFPCGWWSHSDVVYLKFTFTCNTITGSFQGHVLFLRETIHDFCQMNSFCISPHCGVTFTSVVDKFRVIVKFSLVLEIINSRLWLGYSKVLRHSVAQHWFLNSFLVINTRNMKWPKFAFALFFCSRCDGISVKIYK